MTLTKGKAAETSMATSVDDWAMVEQTNGLPPMIWWRRYRVKPFLIGLMAASIGYRCRFFHP
jgi:hypothetical protein